MDSIGLFEQNAKSKTVPISRESQKKNIYTLWHHKGPEVEAS